MTGRTDLARRILGNALADAGARTDLPREQRAWFAYRVGDLELRTGRLAAAVLAGNGRLALVGTDPDAWGRTTSVVDADLAPGRPLHAETWAHLLEERGFGDIARRDGTPSYVVTAVRQR